MASVTTWSPKAELDALETSFYEKIGIESKNNGKIRDINCRVVGLLEQIFEMSNAPEFSNRKNCLLDCEKEILTFQKKFRLQLLQVEQKTSNQDLNKQFIGALEGLIEWVIGLNEPEFKKELLLAFTGENPIREASIAVGESLGYNKYETQLFLLLIAIKNGFDFCSVEVDKKKIKYLRSQFKSFINPAFYEHLIIPKAPDIHINEGFALATRMNIQAFNQMEAQFLHSTGVFKHIEETGNTLFEIEEEVDHLETLGKKIHRIKFKKNRLLKKRIIFLKVCRNQIARNDPLDSFTAAVDIFNAAYPEIPE
ncbi:MAG: hypothetical protein KAR79_00190 [Simkaniaceae bacterium]|nr:hypothetical protein [Simkaniaceae bacterium]